MRSLKTAISKLSLSTLAGLSLCLCLTAFLINLGTIAFIGDEAIRTLVAFEMDKTGNYIVPTLNGEGYFNKPPLFNWMILLTSKIFGYFGEWPSRLTSLLFLGLFAWTVYYFVRKHFDKLTAVTMALMLLTSGRILFWDSMLGLIDICFSFVVFLNFMILYHLAKAGQWRKLFLLSYTLFSAAFMLKGLPALVFQGISMLTALVFHGALKQKIFSKDHIIGASLGIIPVLMYYAVYASQVSLEHVFSILLDQSLQRTVVNHGIADTLVHFLTFPFEQAYHFMPWSLLAILFIHPRFWKWLKQNKFIHFCFWMLAANIPVYWFSVQVFPRYLLMFIPLFNLIGFYILVQTKEYGKTWTNIFRYTFLALTVAAAIVIVLMPLHPEVKAIHGIEWIWISCSMLILGALICLWLDSHRTFLWFALTLLIVRTAFNLVVLPIRSMDYRENICRASCQRLGSAYGDKSWFIFDQTPTQEVARFYTARYTNQLIRKTDQPTDTAAFYIVERNMYPHFPGYQVDSLILERGQVLGLMKAGTQ